MVDRNKVAKIVSSVVKNMEDSKKEKDAEFSEITEEEKKKLDGSRLQLAIQYQQELRSLYLQFSLKYSEYLEMDRQIKEKDIQVLWSGMKCPEVILKNQVMIILNDLKLLQSRMNWLSDGLKEYGLDEKQISEARDMGRFYKGDATNEEINKSLNE